MITSRENSNLFAQGIAVVLGLLLCVPFLLVGTKTIRAYTGLQDVRFQGEKLLKQRQLLSRELQIQQEKVALLQINFNLLDGSTSQANAELQRRLRSLITSVGGNVETSSQVNAQTNNNLGTTSTLRPVYTSVRWSVSEDGLAQFLAKSAAPEQNLKIDNLLIRRRQGTASLLDIRMLSSALWQDPSAADIEASP